MKKLPNTAEELIDLLDKLIPEPAPRPHTPDREILYQAGRRSVVLMLKEMRRGDVPTPLRELRGEGRIVSRKDP